METSEKIAFIALAGVFSSASLAYAGPEVVSGPGFDPQCFAPWSAETKYFQWPAKPAALHKIAVVNGFVGNTWRIQMIQTAKAYARAPTSPARSASSRSSRPAPMRRRSSAPSRTSSTGAIDGIVVNAVTTDGFDRVIRLANRENVVLVAFDNVLDTDEILQVNQDQYAQGVAYAGLVVAELGKQGKTKGKILEVRGISGNSVDRDRSKGVHDVFAKSGGPWEIITVNGQWDDGAAQKVTADAIAVHGNTFDGFVVQGGTTGVVQAMIDAKHPFVPIGGEAENGYRKLDRPAFG